MRQPAYTIYTTKGRCACWSEKDLETNLDFARREGWSVIEVARETTPQRGANEREKKDSNS